MEPEGSLPHSQASATRPYPGLAWSSPHAHNQPFNIQKVYTLPTQCIYAPLGQQNKRRLIPCTILTELFLQPREKMFTARYKLAS